MNFISFVVDGFALHYYQAELLLFSLKEFARHPKDRILVHCTTKVSDEFIGFLTDNGYLFKIIQPFLDEKYCNKIKQLESFDVYKEANVFFLDTDMFVLGQLRVPDEAAFSAKIVDGSHPPLAVIENIFKNAGVDIPEIILTDWVLDNSWTISANFNGGFYYIPNQYLKQISKLWEKWAVWLYERKELFSAPSQVNHIDQLSMALAFSEAKLPYKPLPANSNCPTHSDRQTRSFDDQRPVTVLHYHREINQFGLLAETRAANAAVLQAIRTANQAITNYSQFYFYSGFRKSLIKEIVPTPSSVKLSAAIEKFTASFGDQLQLIFHGGTPKTATTSLQYFFAESSEDLKKQGFLYPSNYSVVGEPKHQWLVTALLKNDVDLLISHFENLFAEIDSDIHTIIVSTEGIYNHWLDFSQEAKSFLAVISKHFDAKLLVSIREPKDFINSLYLQYLKNPQVKNLACYGQDMSLADMMQDEWFVKHLDYLGFIQEAETVFKKENIYALPYKGDIVAKVCEVLKISLCPEKNVRKNKSSLASTVDILRVINRYPLKPQEKNRVLALLKQMDEILSPYPLDANLDEGIYKSIRDLCSLGLFSLSMEYGLVIE